MNSEDRASLEADWRKIAGDLENAVAGLEKVLDRLRAARKPKPPPQVRFGCDICPREWATLAEARTCRDGHHWLHRAWCRVVDAFADFWEGVR